MTVTEFRTVANPAIPPTQVGEDSPAARYLAVRRQTERICQPLEIEDYVVQTIPDISPAKWHLAHTSWFFERFLLVPHSPGYREFHPQYNFLFNSYYVTVGARHCRVARGQITRPTVREVYEYRKHIDGHMAAFLDALHGRQSAELKDVIEIGLNHEQQHQELMVTDVKHVYGCNPLYPVYHAREIAEPVGIGPARWVSFEEGVREVGHAGDSFAFDNELPRHKVYVQPFRLADRTVTNGEFIDFIADGGYSTPTLWLSDGAACAAANGWDAPFYWENRDGEWWNFTLNGMRKAHPDEPLVHASYFEADAFARWAGARLPTEQEWEVACEASGPSAEEGNFVEDETFHPVVERAVGSGQWAEKKEPNSPPSPPAAHCPPPTFLGNVWEWTRSQYDAYPGYAPPAGALGEYNGKFMCNQFVLRGGSCATPRAHIRPTYRNFFPPEARWQFSGLRLAKDA